MIMVLNSLVDGTTTLFPLHKKEGNVAALQNLLYKFKFTPDSDRMSYDRIGLKNLQSSVPVTDASIQP